MNLGKLRCAYNNKISCSGSKSCVECIKNRTTADDLLEKQRQIIKESTDEYKKLKAMDENIEKALEDIDHAIEFLPPLAVVKGYKLYKMRKRILETRRVLIQRKSLLTPLFQHNHNKNSHDSLERIKQSVSDKRAIYDQNETVRAYRVKILTDIFGETLQNGKKKDVNFDGGTECVES